MDGVPWDLEKAFDRVPREVVLWALRQMDLVDGWLINAAKSMYKNAKTSVKVNGVGGRDYPVERWEFNKGQRAHSTTLYHSYGSATPRGLMTEDCLGSCYMQMIWCCWLIRRRI